MGFSSSSGDPSNAPSPQQMQQSIDQWEQTQAARINAEMWAQLQQPGVTEEQAQAIRQEQTLKGQYLQQAVQTMRAQAGSPNVPPPGGMPSGIPQQGFSGAPAPGAPTIATPVAGPNQGGFAFNTEGGTPVSPEYTAQADIRRKAYLKYMADAAAWRDGGYVGPMPQPDTTGWASSDMGASGPQGLALQKGVQPGGVGQAVKLATPPWGQQYNVPPSAWPDSGGQPGGQQQTWSDMPTPGQGPVFGQAPAFDLGMEGTRKVTAPPTSYTPLPARTGTRGAPPAGGGYTPLSAFGGGDTSMGGWTGGLMGGSGGWKWPSPTATPPRTQGVSQQPTPAAPPMIPGQTANLRYPQQVVADRRAARIRNRYTI